MNIRKISVGPDYKSGAMHYLVGQDVLNGSYDYKSGAMHYLVGQDILGGSHKIHLIQQKKETGSIIVWIEKGDEVFMWKEFNSTMPISIEYNINF